MCLCGIDGTLPSFLCTYILRARAPHAARMTHDATRFGFDTAPYPATQPRARITKKRYFRTLVSVRHAGAPWLVCMLLA